MQFFPSKHLRGRHFYVLTGKTYSFAHLQWVLAWTNVDDETNINTAMFGVFKVIQHDAPPAISKSWILHPEMKGGEGVGTLISLGKSSNDRNS